MANIPVPMKMNVSNVVGAIADKTDFWKGLPPDIISGIGTLVVILKAVGIVFLIYLVFMIVRSILNLIEKRRIKEIHRKIFEIDKKLDKILEKKKK